MQPIRIDTLLRELAIAREELDNGEGISNEELFSELRSKYSK